MHSTMLIVSICLINLWFFYIMLRVLSLIPSFLKVKKTPTPVYSIRHKLKSIFYGVSLNKPQFIVIYIIAPLLIYSMLFVFKYSFPLDSDPYFFLSMCQSLFFIPLSLLPLSFVSNFYNEGYLYKSTS